MFLYTRCNSPWLSLPSMIFLLQGLIMWRVLRIIGIVGAQGSCVSCPRFQPRNNDKNDTGLGAMPGSRRISSIPDAAPVSSLDAVIVHIFPR